MRLRTFESFSLLKNGLLYSYPSLQNDITAEMVVIGGGITGALISHALMEKGYKVLLLDKRDIAQGSSAATTGLLQYEIDVPLIELCEMIGEEAAVLCYKAGIQAINTLAALVQEQNIDCSFKLKGSLYMAHSKKAAVNLRKEYDLRDKHNMGVRWLSSGEVEKEYGLKSYGGIVSTSGGCVDAYKLAHELIQLNVKRGMQVYDQTEINKFNLDDANPSIEISNGIKVSCNKVIFCTGFETTEMLKEKIATLFYTYACVSEAGIKVCDNIKNSVVWDTDNPYMYMRCTDDGRLLIGGEDSSNNLPFFQQNIKNKKSGKLVKKIAQIAPGITFIPDINWGGTFGSTKDGLPYIGESPEYKNSLFVLGFGGNGITFSVQAMDIILQTLAGKVHPLAAYYKFGR
jgi:glycine/D-amino acid oxidase-like deaminating enzyme